MRNINVSINDEKGKLNKYFNFCVGAGRAAEIMRYIPSVQLKQVVKDCGFRYIRFHGIFNEDMGVATRSEDGKLSFNFQYIDMLFDYFLEIGIRPFLELSFMPKCMASGDQTLFFWDTNVTPPAKNEEWVDFIKCFMNHLTLRYGEEEIKKWFFEVWNEPNHPAFFSRNDDMEEYFKLYEITARAIKDVNKDYQVGGPATAGMIWFDCLDEYCKKHNVPIDFFSGHCYCVVGDFDEDGKKDLFLQDEFSLLVNPIKKHTKMSEDAGLPMHITEWSTSYSSRDPVHDTYINAAFVLDAIKNLDGFADSLSYWVYTDIFEEAGPAPSPFHGGFGIINEQSLKKPTYYSYKFLNELGDTELKCEDNATYACKKDDEIEILTWNYVKQDQHKVSNRTFYKNILPAEKLDDVEINVSDLENGKYEVTIQTIGFKKGDVYTEYAEKKLGMLERREDIEYLSKFAEPETNTIYVEVIDNKLDLVLENFENQIDFIKIKKY